MINHREMKMVMLVGDSFFTAIFPVRAFVFSCWQAEPKNGQRKVTIL
jgi:hypothetical protein